MMSSDVCVLLGVCLGSWGTVELIRELATGMSAGGEEGVDARGENSTLFPLPSS